MTHDNTYQNDLFVRAAHGEKTERTPIWLMRQAGRTDPEYNRLKEELNMPLEDMFSNPEIAARVSLLPKRLGIDAIIFFQDILTILTPMGAEFKFRPGPVLDEPIRSTDQVRSLHHFDVATELPFIEKTFELIHGELDGEMPVLGFAGAPLTLLFFLVEGKSFGSSADNSLGLLSEKPQLAHELLDTIARATIDYLKLQIEVGAAALQLFESAAYLLSPEIYEEFALPYQQQIFEAISGEVPTINFARDWNDLDSLDSAGADIISLPASISIAQARERLGENRIFQGNLDNQLLAQGSLEEIEEAALTCIRSGQQQGHIFNLNHGLLRDTPYENIVHLVDIVRQTNL